MTDGPVVAVRGQAYREFPPELARFQVTATARERDRQATLTRLAERAAAVRVLLDEHQPPVDRRETGDLWVRPETRRSGERVVGYRGSVTTTVTVTDFATLADLMLRLADLEQVEIAGPDWSLRPDSPAHRETRYAAIDDALRRAREYAEALGARVTALLELADPDDGYGVMVAGGAASYRSNGPAEMELDPLTQTVHAVVRARFTITEPVLG